MIIFDDTYAETDATSSDFLLWREVNPDAFVVNRKGTENMIHYAKCGHFTFSPNSEASLTNSKKVCSRSRKEIDRWVASAGIKILQVCKDCKPGSV
jgi:hypothetical protein